MLPEFDYGGQFAVFRECLTVGRGRRFVDAEHGASMVGRPASGKRRSQSGILRSASTGAMVGCVTALDSSLVGASRPAMHSSDLGLVNGDRASARMVDRAGKTSV
jgi:hypothetical protein